LGLIATALAPVGVLLVAAALVAWRPWQGWLFVAEAATLVALVVVGEAAAQAPLVVTLYTLLPGVALQFRVDVLGVVLAGIPAAIGALAGLAELLAPLDSSSRARAWLLVAQAGVVFTVMASGLATMAAAWAGTVVALTLATVLTRREHVPAGAARRFGLAGATSAVLAVAGAAAVQTAAGTTSFTAVPPDAISVGAMFLLAAMPAQALGYGILAVRATRAPAEAAIAWAVLVTAGAGALLRLVDAGGGELPMVAVRYALLVGGGLGALANAVGAWWAADLRGVAGRVLQAGACLCLVAAGIGGALAPAVVVALLVESAVAAFVLLSAADAGDGRLPGTPLLAGLACLAVAAAAGLPVGLGVYTRAALVRLAADAGPGVVAATLPALLAFPAMALAGLLSLRFHAAGSRGGRVAGARLALATALAVAVVFAAPALAAALAPALAETAGVPAAQLQGGIGRVLLGTVPMDLAAAAMVAVVAAWAAWRARAGRPFWPRTRGLLPPRLAFAPRLARLRAGHAAAGWLAGARRRLTLPATPVLTAAWAGAAAALVVVFIR